MFVTEVETLCCGDLVTYYNPTKTGGYPTAKHTGTATVVTIDKDYPPVLSTGHILSVDQRIKKDKLSRPMDSFLFVHSGDESHADAVMVEAGSTTRILQRQTDVVRRRAKKDGFASMDVIITQKGGLMNG